MELKIEQVAIPEKIAFNYEELKQELSDKVKMYETLVYSDEDIKSAKADRADLNRLKKALNDERIRREKEYMQPFNVFKAQINEIIDIIDKPIRMIDAQIKEVEENKKEQKRKDIEGLFKDIGFQTFVTLEQIFDGRWLNASVSLNSIREQMESRMYQIGNDVLSINQLPEFSFEAMEIYKSTLDIGQAIQEGRRLSEIQKQKAAYEAEQKRLKEEVQAKKAVEEAEIQNKAEEELETAKIQDEQTENSEAQKEQLITIDFRVTATNEQLAALKKFLIENRIVYGPVPRKGE